MNNQVTIATGNNTVNRGTLLIENIYDKKKQRGDVFKAWFFVIMFDAFFLSMFVLLIFMISSGRLHFMMCIPLFWSVVFAVILYVGLSLGSVDLLGRGPGLYTNGIKVYYVDGLRNVERFVPYTEIDRIIIELTEERRNMIAELQAKQERSRDIARKPKKRNEPWTEADHKSSVNEHYNKISEGEIYIMTKTEEVFPLDRYKLEAPSRIVEILQRNNVAID